MLLASERRWTFTTPPPALWALISDVPSYPLWWPWLRVFDGERLEPGAIWHCQVKPPLPYVVDFTMTIGEVVATRSITASLDGDIAGSATIEITPAGAAASLVLLTAELAPAKRWLSTLSFAARPIVRYGHNWVLDTGAGQFARACGLARTRQ